mgnify:CR=1 FL=1
MRVSGFLSNGAVFHILLPLTDSHQAATQDRKALKYSGKITAAL